jgi:hypothetical protein
MRDLGFWVCCFGMMWKVNQGGMGQKDIYFSEDFCLLQFFLKVCDILLDEVGGQREIRQGRVTLPILYHTFT